MIRHRIYMMSILFRNQERIHAQGEPLPGKESKELSYILLASFPQPYEDNRDQEIL